MAAPHAPRSASPHVEELKRDYHRMLYHGLGRFAAVATPNDKYLALSYAVRGRLVGRAMATAEAYRREQEPHGLLPVGRVPARPAAREHPAQPGPHGRGAPGDGGSRGGPRRAARARGGARARQRRPRAARRLLHGLARDARLPGDRPRHPLRVRHLRPGHPRRLAGRAHRRWLRYGNPWEIRALRDRAPGRLRRPHRGDDRRRRPVPRTLDPRARRQRRAVRHAGPRLRRRRPRTSSGSGAPRRRSSTSTRSRSASTGARSRRRSAARTSRRCSTRTTRSRRASSCGSSSSTSSCRARCRTASACSCSAHDRPRVRRQVRDPAQRHAPGARGARADAAAHRRARARLGRGVGASPAHLRVHEPHAAARGARDVAAAALRAPPAAPPRDHLRDQPALPRRGARAVPGRRGAGRAACRSSTRTATSTCAWRTSRRSRATTSTASPRCTRGSCARPCCATSPSCGPSGSRT